MKLFLILIGFVGCASTVETAVEEYAACSTCLCFDGDEDFQVGVGSTVAACKANCLSTNQNYTCDYSGS